MRNAINATMTEHEHTPYYIYFTKQLSLAGIMRINLGCRFMSAVGINSA